MDTMIEGIFKMLDAYPVLYIPVLLVVVFLIWTVERGRRVVTLEKRKDVKIIGDTAKWAPNPSEKNDILNKAFKKTAHIPIQKHSDKI